MLSSKLDYRTGRSEATRKICYNQDFLRDTDWKCQGLLLIVIVTKLNF